MPPEDGLAEMAGQSQMPKSKSATRGMESTMPSDRDENISNRSQTSFKNSVGRSQSSGSSMKTTYYTDASESLTVHLTTSCGTRIELQHVPRRFYASELEVLLMRDTGMKHDHFQIFHQKALVKPMMPIELLVGQNDMVELSLKLRKAEDNAKKIRLGERDIKFKSGMAIHLICKKVFVSSKRCAAEDILTLQHEKDGVLTREDVNIQWLPHDHHKPFLGGYRNKLTNARYHNATVQTKPKPKSRQDTDTIVYSRETQTYRMKHFGQTTVNQMSTQFPKPGYFVSNAKDQVRVPGPYETADEYLERKLRDVIIIQKYTRRWLAKRRVDKLRRLRDARLEWERQHEAKLKEDKEKQLKHDFERRLHPKTQADFDRLFSALEQWKREQIAMIDAQHLTQAERKAALALLLNEETEMIAAIGRHQICVSQKSDDRSRINLLRKAAASIRWFSAITSRPIEAETQQTLKGKELLDIFISLRLENLTEEERLDLLLTTKRLVKQYEFKVCNELARLIDREAELIMMGVKDEHLQGLRRRINNRFVKFCEIPEVNPEIVNYLKVPNGSKAKVSESLKGDVHYCLACDRYLRHAAFPLSARANRLAPCEACRRLDNRARKRLDLDQYQRMLTELREKELDLVEQARLRVHEQAKEEELVRLEKGERPNPESVCKVDGTDFTVLNTNPFPFLVDKQDIQFLVDDVWERRSVLSGWLDIMDLVLTRWRLDEPWSPWNTILVTRVEAEAHERLGKFPLELAYADAMLNTVNQRLVMGRNAFVRLRNNGIKMAYEQVVLAQWMQHPENTQEWLREKRQRLPPLAKGHGLMNRSDSRHDATYQPPAYMLPAIRGEKRLSEVMTLSENAKST